VYDAKGRDPVAEVAALGAFWKDDGLTGEKRTILDVGCGTGSHLATLSEHGRVEGLDRSLDMLGVARQRFPEVPLHLGDMCSFELNRRFDVVTCLFGSAGYVSGRPALRRALSAMGRHVGPGGVLLVEPPLFEERFDAPRDQQIEVDLDVGTLVRQATSHRDGAFLEIEFDWHHRDSDGTSLDRVLERHRLLLLNSKQWKEDAKRALPQGTRIEIDQEGPIGRGLLIARISPSGARGSG
jgi:SAM-dependent methyltransferase